MASYLTVGTRIGRDGEAVCFEARSSIALIPTATVAANHHLLPGRTILNSQHADTNLLAPSSPTERALSPAESWSAVPSLHP